MAVISDGTTVDTTPTEVVDHRTEGEITKQPGFFFIPAGHQKFFIKNKKVKCGTVIYSHAEQARSKYEIIGDLFSGSQFLDMVDSGCIINYDGMLGLVIVDKKFITNLGLSHKGFSQGECKLNAKQWKDLCYKYEVLVEWCNR